MHSRRSTQANKFSKPQIKTTCQLQKKYYRNYCHIILSRQKCVCWQELNFLFWTPMSWKWIDVTSVLVTLFSACLKSKAKCFPVSQYEVYSSTIWINGLLAELSQVYYWSHLASLILVNILQITSILSDQSRFGSAFISSVSCTPSAPDSLSVMLMLAC